MVLSTFLDWRGNTSGLSTDSMGLFGILTLLFGLAVAAVGGIKAFAPQVGLPERVLNFSISQVAVILAFTVFLWTFGVQLGGDSVKIGMALAWIGGAVATVGGVMDSMAAAPRSGGAPRSF